MFDEYEMKKSHKVPGISFTAIMFWCKDPYNSVGDTRSHSGCNCLSSKTVKVGCSSISVNFGRKKNIETRVRTHV